MRLPSAFLVLKEAEKRSFPTRKTGDRVLMTAPRRLIGGRAAPLGQTQTGDRMAGPERNRKGPHGPKE
jgi:hypothetical protein